MGSQRSISPRIARKVRPRELPLFRTPGPSGNHSTNPDKLSFIDHHGCGEELGVLPLGDACPTYPAQEEGDPRSHRGYIVLAIPYCFARESSLLLVTTVPDLQDPISELLLSMPKKGKSPSHQDSPTADSYQRGSRTHTFKPHDLMTSASSYRPLLD